MRTWLEEHLNVKLVLIAVWWLVCVGFLGSNLGDLGTEERASAGWWLALFLSAGWLYLGLQAMDRFRETWKRT